MAGMILVPWPGIECGPTAVKVLTTGSWTISELPWHSFLSFFFFKKENISQENVKIVNTCMCVHLLKFCLTATLWTVAHQASLSMGFFRKNTGVGSHSLLQGIFPTQRSNLGLLHCRQILYWSNQSILKEINPEYSLEGLMLTLKLQYLGHLIPKANSLKKPLILGKIEGMRRRGWQKDCYLVRGAVLPITRRSG